MTKNRLTAF